MKTRSASVISLTAVLGILALDGACGQQYLFPDKPGKEFPLIDVYPHHKLVGEDTKPWNVSEHKDGLIFEVRYADKQYGYIDLLLNKSTGTFRYHCLFTNDKPVDGDNFYFVVEFRDSNELTLTAVRCDAGVDPGSRKDRWIDGTIDRTIWDQIDQIRGRWGFVDTAAN